MNNYKERIMLENEITKDNTSLLVMRFYTKVLKDEAISSFFIEKLGADMKNTLWQKHILLLSDFWYTISLGKGDYRGNPFGPHLQIEGLKRESFESWLKIFFLTVDNIYTQEIALKFKEKSTIIAGNFMRNLRL